MSKAKELARVPNHGYRRTPTYKSWESMKRRCNNPNDGSYKNYGGRGIKVCEEWNGRRSFLKFLEDMGPRPKGYQIDRIDVNGNYCKENCRWVTMAENMRNTRRNIYIEFNGRRMVLSEWAREINLSLTSLWGRLFKHGWTIERALTTPAQDKRIDINGERKTISEWCKIYDVAHGTVRTRVRNKWPLIKALTTPIDSRMRNSKARIKEAS